MSHRSGRSSLPSTDVPPDLPPCTSNDTHTAVLARPLDVRDVFALDSGDTCVGVILRPVEHRLQGHFRLALDEHCRFGQQARGQRCEQV